MWKPKKVERGLFRWGKWRQSIIEYWVKNPSEELSEEKLSEIVKLGTQALSLPDSFFLGLYWISCIASDYCLDYPVTYEKIVVPDWFPIPHYQLPERDYKLAPFGNILKTGMRVYPPPVLEEKDIDFFVQQGGYEAVVFRNGYYPKKNDYGIYLATNHELCLVLEQLKGRTKSVGRVGRIPSHSDRLAVNCAAQILQGKTYVQVAKQFGIPVVTPYISEQSDSARWLVKRGKKLIDELGGAIV